MACFFITLNFIWISLVVVSGKPISTTHHWDESISTTHHWDESGATSVSPASPANTPTNTPPSSTSPSHVSTSTRRSIELVFPWQLSVRYNGEPICSATLIEPIFALTSDKCVKDDTKNVTLLAGDDRHFPSGQSEEIKIKEIIKYNDKGHVIMLKFKKPVNVTHPGIKPIELADAGEKLSKCISTGWGSQSGNASDEDLGEIEMKVAKSKDCTDAKLTVGQNETCFVSKKKACSSDRRGPLICQRKDGTYVLYGTEASAGNDCNKSTGKSSKTSVVYTEASYYRFWMTQASQKT